MSALNADHFGALATMLRQRGYGFITLDDALRDSAYAAPLGFSGHEGESWLENWARQVGLRPSNHRQCLISSRSGPDRTPTGDTDHTTLDRARR